MCATFTHRAAVLALAFCAAAVPASAQTEEFQSFRISGWSFTPALATGAVYDSNVALTSPRTSEGQTQGDVLFNVIPSGQLEYIGKRTTLSAGYRGFLRRYADVEGLDGFDQRASFGFRRTMTKRLTVFARNNFSDSPTTDEVEVNGVPFQRTGSRTNTAAVGTEFRLTKFTTAGARYDATWVHFERDDETVFLTGGWINALGGDVTHQLNERLSLGGEYSYRTASLGDGDREFGFQDAGGTARLRLGPHTSASAALGLATLEDRNAGDTRMGPYFRINLDHVLEYAMVGGGFERQYVPSFGFGGSSASQELRGYIRMPLSRRMYVQGTTAWRRSVPFETTALEADTIWIRSSLGYMAARWARLEALYAFTSQDSIITGGEVSRHRAGLQVVVSHPMRIR
jgi:hypothetical protein